MEFRHLRYFLVLADELHFGRSGFRACRPRPDGASRASCQPRTRCGAGQGMAGSLTIGFAGTLLYSSLSGILARFQASHPLLRVQLKEFSSSEQLIELAHERLDLGFVHTTRVPPGLSQILVSSQPFAGCLPAGHALAGQRSLLLTLLQSEAFAVVSRVVSPDYHARILAICTEAGFHPEIRYELQHWLSVASLVSPGMGVALILKALSRSALAGAAT